MKLEAACSAQCELDGAGVSALLCAFLQFGFAFSYTEVMGYRGQALEFMVKD
jgi:hypothetical protein